MQALRLHDFGSLDNVHLEQVADPSPGPGQVLVRNHVSGVNPVDWKVAMGYFRPPFAMPMTLGWDSAGVVERLGEGVTRFKAGDRVTAFPNFMLAASHAELQTFPEADVVALPDSLTFSQAATLPVAGLTAWQSLFDTAHLERGQSVLIHAAAGSVGLLAVQLAKEAGARVIATASAAKHDFVRSLGADEVIDYRTTAFETVVKGVDVVFDTVGGETQTKSLGVLKPGGYIVSAVQPPDAAALQVLGIRGSMVGVAPDAVALGEIVRRAGTGQLRTVIDRTLPAADFRAAFDYSITGRAQGKILLTWA